jgi:DNA invertase Pin-like site-specific DNA recombinase
MLSARREIIMKTNDIKKAVCYLRYSPGPDQDENSIIGQRKVITEYAEREEYTIVDEYIDRAATGTKADRTNFLRMIADSERGLFQFVIVYQLDRFARNRTDSSIYRGILNKNGVKLISAKENISDNSSGIILQGVLETLAEYYSVELSEKIKRGYSTKASQCLYLGGTVPLGYFIDEHKHFQFDTATAGYVQTIFEMYADGKTIREINEYLNQQNISSNRGNSFTKNSLSKLFQNKRYTGTYTFKDTEIPNGIPRIISDELFDRVQLRMGEKKKASSKGKAIEEYILTPKLLCGHCKATTGLDVLMTGESGTSKTGKLHTYYKCNSSKKRKCDKKVVKKKYIEDLVVNLAREQLTDENLEIIINEMEKIYVTEQDNSNLKRLKKLLKECEAATENLLKALEQGQAADIITDRLVKKQVETQEIKKLIAKEELIYTDFDINKVRFFLYKLKIGDINDIKYRKALIHLFIDRVYLYDDKITLIFSTDKKPLDITLSLLEEIGVCEGSSVDNQPAVKSRESNFRVWFFLNIVV